MNAKHWITLMLLGGLAIPTVLILYWRTTTAPSRSWSIRSDQANGESSTPPLDRARLGEIERELVRMRGSIATVRAAHRDPGSPEDLAAPHDEGRRVLDEMEPKARDELMTRTAVAMYEDLVTNEGRDMSWAHEQEDSIAIAIGALDESTLDEAVCASTLCRATIVHESPDARGELKAIVGVAPFNTSCFGTPTPKGLGTVLYCSRTGHKLPSVDLLHAAMNQ